jgi:hypothetical protein
LPGYTKLTVHTPGGAALFTKTVSSGQEAKFALPQLPSTGTYAILVQPAAASTGTVKVEILEEAEAVLDSRGGAQVLSLARGQNGRCSFSGRSGEFLGLAYPAIATTPAGASVSLSIHKPDGTSLGSTTASAPGSWQLEGLPAMGTYSIVVQPSGISGAAITLSLSQPVNGKLLADEAPTRFESSRPGQPGRYAFQGVAGQAFTIRATATATFPTGVGLTVERPDGTEAATGVVPNGGDIKVDVGVLDATGTYSVAVVPRKLETGAVDLRLITTDVGELIVGDPPTAVTLAAGQNGRYGFTVSAGAFLSIGYPTLVTTPSGRSITLATLAPGGTTFATLTPSAPGVWHLPAASSTGTHAMTVSPSGTAGANVTFLISPAVTGTIAMDGSATQFETARAGQAGRYTFPGTAAQSFTLYSASSFTTGVSLTIYQPNGASVGNATTQAGGSAKIDLGNLPATGTYTVVAAPAGAGTGSMSLTLLPQALDALVVGEAPKALTLNTGQNGRYTFEANAGDLLAFARTALSMNPPGGTVSLKSYKPDGSLLGSSSASQGDGTWALPQIPTTGTYVLALSPPGTAAISLSAQIVRR